MSTLDPSTRALAGGYDLGEVPIDEAHLAAAAFLSRYRARTLEAYRYDLRIFFQWAADHGLDVLAATRPEIELYVRTMEEQGLAATTIDRRLSTVCGMYRFAHMDSRITSNPAQSCTAPRCTSPRPGAWTDPSSGRSCSRPSATTMPTLRSPCYSDSTFASERGVLHEHRGPRVRAQPPRVLRFFREGQQASHHPTRATDPPNYRLAIGERQQGPILRRADGQRLDRRTARRWVRSIAKRAGLGVVRPHMLRRMRSVPEVAGEHLHHGRPQSRRPPARRADRGPAPTPGRPSATTTGAPTSTSTPPTSWSPSSPEADLPWSV